MAIVKRLENQTFGRLTVLDEVGRTKSGGATWRCICTCGREVVVTSDALRSGKTRSCGCIKQEQRLSQKTHGETHSPIHNLWSGMRNRCNNPNNRKYERYGARGIRVCDEWDSSYEAFRDWCLANGYRRGLTIERLDVDGDYSPENCIFATQKVQQNNRSNNHRITYNGATRTMSEWADLLGMSYKMLEHRLNRGWTVDEAFTIPKGGKRYAMS